MKVNVKIGEVFHRASIGEVDEELRGRIIHHIEHCPACAELIKKRVARKSS